MRTYLVKHKKKSFSFRQKLQIIFTKNQEKNTHIFWKTTFDTKIRFGWYFRCVSTISFYEKPKGRQNSTYYTFYNVQTAMESVTLAVANFQKQKCAVNVLVYEWLVLCCIHTDTPNERERKRGIKMRCTHVDAITNLWHGPNKTVQRKIDSNLCEMMCGCHHYHWYFVVSYFVYCVFEFVKLFCSLIIYDIHTNLISELPFFYSKIPNKRGIFFQSSQAEEYQFKWLYFGLVLNVSSNFSIYNVHER